MSSKGLDDYFLDELGGANAPFGRWPEELGGLASVSVRWDAGAHRAWHLEAYRKALMEAREPRSTTKDRSRYWARRARILRLVGRENKAKEGFKTALEFDPDNAEALAWRWELEGGDGLSRSIALEPRPLWRAWAAISGEAESLEGNTPGALIFDLALALCEMRRGRFFESFKRLGGAASRESEEPWIWPLVAREAFRAGSEEECEKAAFNAARFQQDLAPFGFLLFGELADFSGEGAPKTLEAARDFARRNPEEAWPHVLQGLCFRSPSLENRESEIGAMKRAAEVDPKCGWVRAFLGRSLVQAKRLEEGAEDLGAAASLDPETAWLPIWFGECLGLLGQHDRALEQFDRGLAIRPGYAFGLAWKGALLQQMGRRREARENLNRAFRLDPEYGKRFVWAWRLEDRRALLKN